MPKKTRSKPAMAELFTPPLTPPAPNFERLLKDPLIKAELPDGFSVVEEAAHLVDLWNRAHKLRDYRFDRFVHAGGSGMVFKERDARPLSQC